MNENINENKNERKNSQLSVGIVQLTSTLDPEQNLKVIRHFIAEAKEKDIHHIFLPECFYSLSNGLQATPFLVEEKNEHYNQIQALAKDFNVYILGGSASTLVNGRIYNRAYNFNPQGEELAIYDKNHLFVCNLTQADRHLSTADEKRIIDESMIFTPGEGTKILSLGEWNIGLGICFDLRFPEMFRDYTRQGANLLSISAAFTVPTGRAHWHTLLRARAIENQCFVVAPAQWGRHNERISTFGHSLIIDPWGEILADGGEGEKLISATLDLDLVQEVRKRMKVF